MPPSPAHTSITTVAQTTESPLLVRIRVPPAKTSGNGRSSPFKGVRIATDASVERPRKRQNDDTETEVHEKQQRKKPTYTARKEEVHELREQVHALQAFIIQLQKQKGLPTAADNRSLELCQSDNEAMGEKIWEQTMALNGIRSLLSRHMNRLVPRPLKTFIRLGRDMTSRRETLIALRQKKLQQSHEFIHERLRHQDEREEYEVLERFADAEGNFNCSACEIVHFEGVQSVKQVYDALIYYLFNMEITISEQLGDLTLREDIDAMDSRISNHRLVSQSDHGVVMETNAVLYSQYSERSAESNGGEFGLVAADCVDIDDLHPYLPLERCRKDIVAAVSLSSFRRPRRDGYGEDLVVVLKRSAFLTLYRPQFEISRETLSEMQEKLLNWGGVMLNSLREALYQHQ
ncbi:hypothetical protein Poli38472_012378 [Pythium oligandrum]|uniref:Uncharacterized protein n=1 Tax=Pythium oligandrum TaxID=41045 RepID=A0A8K1FPU3_PYTOL|nr:hypothetical protein Poli38472_012378 [Pythium oligandrum]|eukprot:TMW67262.1 hypothetical protein Poli38472_012378 [Pythium oligandrum]